jgi:hypothetical protein
MMKIVGRRDSVFIKMPVRQMGEEDLLAKALSVRSLA